MSRRRMQDHFGRRAKTEGRPARSIYKLEEIDKRWHLIRQGNLVLDLGCAPGSWLQYTAAKVGSQGRVIGYDLKAVTISLPSNTQARVGDAFNIEASQLPGAIDVVLSDMAPATMGDHKTDAIRSANLAKRALDMALQHLKPGGHVVVKVLEGGDVPSIVQRMRHEYGKVELLRPLATRRQSTEIFLVGLRKKDNEAL
ncbi:MAG: RlmE family RNA methyltransferase [Deltaproteobacteria bacterium]|nr:RlmE family RNA methyltransferase [Deltaproteobacteria bacterium]